MSLEGPKMVERRYGLAGNGRKIKKNPITHGGHCRRFADPIRARLAAVGRETSRMTSSGCPPPPCLARVTGGWPESSPLVQNPTARKWFKMTQLGSTSFGELL